MNKLKIAPARSKFSILQQICNFIPQHLVSQIARTTGVEDKSRTFTPWSHVVSLGYAQLTHSIGLNDVCDSLQLHTGSLAGIRGASAPSRNGLSNANRERPAEMAEQLFWQVMNHLGEQSPGLVAGRSRGPAFSFKMPRSKDEKILRDEVIVLSNPNKSAPELMRRIVALVEIDGKEREMVFLTNNLEWSPRSVADLYRCRWQIEVFFKQIKQTLQLGDFLGHNANAVRWQVWMALLIYVLLRYLSFLSKWSHSFTRLFTILRAVAWAKLDLLGLLDCYGTAKGSFRNLARPDQAYFPGFL